MNSINWPASSTWVFIAQLGEHCSANTEATGSNPVEAPINFFSGYFRNCLNCDSLRWSHTHLICIPAVHIISFTTFSGWNHKVEVQRSTWFPLALFVILHRKPFNCWRFANGIMSPFKWFQAIFISRAVLSCGLFIMLRKVALTFESSDKFLKCKFSVMHRFVPKYSSFLSQLIPHIDRNKAVNKATELWVGNFM